MNAIDTAYGLVLGLATAPVLADYTSADPAALWQAAGATAAFVAALGALGYASRRDLSPWARILFWAPCWMCSAGGASRGSSGLRGREH